jgi:hypothetical protein
MWIVKALLWALAAALLGTAFVLVITWVCNL